MRLTDGPVADTGKVEAMIEDILARLENYDIRDIHLHDTIACELLRMRDRIAELEIERDDIAASLLKCSEMLILHAKSAGDTIKSLSNKTDNIAKAVFSEIHQTLSEAFQEEIYERDARIAHLEQPVTTEETSAAYDAFYQGGNINDNAMTLALAAALKIRMRAAK